MAPHTLLPSPGVQGCETEAHASVPAIVLLGGLRQGQTQPQIIVLQLPADLPGISLALSLHAPTQEVRRTIVPSAQAYPLDKLIAAVDKYQLLTRQRVSSSLPRAFVSCCAHSRWQQPGGRPGPA